MASRLNYFMGKRIKENLASDYLILSKLQLRPNSLADA